MSIIVPKDEINEFIDQIQQWVNVNNIIESTLNYVFKEIFELIGWKGEAAEAFAQAAKERLLARIQPLLDVLNEFMSWLNWLIDIIQYFIEWSLAPIEWVIDGAGAVVGWLGGAAEDIWDTISFWD
ncbi:MAG: hypothetical protein HY866_21875 [Chloroflexi bacterium]|nr:hypothetical protein [Chloroflexota bacterium]